MICVRPSSRIMPLKLQANPPRNRSFTRSHSFDVLSASGCTHQSTRNFKHINTKSLFVLHEGGKQRKTNPLKKNDVVSDITYVYLHHQRAVKVKQLVEAFETYRAWILDGDLCDTLLHDMRFRGDGILLGVVKKLML